MKKVDLTNKRFGKLIAISSTKVNKRSGWLCECDCGAVSIVITNSLTSGKTTSCGCRKKEVALKNCADYGFKPVHGMTNSPTWKSWQAMHDRCNGTTNGGRYKNLGITVCERWNDFEKFLEDMGIRPTGTSLDRINVIGNYEPINCRWATPKEQMRNKNNTRYLIVNGEKIALMEIAEKLNIKKTAAQYFYSVFKKLTDNGFKVEI